MSRLVAELDGDDLALWVARAIKLDFVMRGTHPAIETEFDPDTHCNESSAREWKCWLYFRPDRDWSQGGPLIEQYLIGFGVPVNDAGLRVPDADYQAFLHKDGTMVVAYGPTHLIAAMRALVASVYGKAVPDEVSLS